MSVHQINSHIASVKIRRAREEDFPEIYRLVLDGLLEIRLGVWRKMILSRPSCQVLWIGCVCELCVGSTSNTTVDQ